MKSQQPSHLRSIIAHIVLILLSFMCLFFFYILIVNATRSHADLQKGFSALPGSYLLKNLSSVANDGTFPMFRGILNSLIVSGCSAAICTYFSAGSIYIYHGDPCHADTGNRNGIPAFDHEHGNV